MGTRLVRSRTVVVQTAVVAVVAAVGEGRVDTEREQQRGASPVR